MSSRSWRWPSPVRRGGGGWGGGGAVLGLGLKVNARGGPRRRPCLFRSAVARQGRWGGGKRRWRSPFLGEGALQAGTAARAGPQCCRGQDRPWWAQLTGQGARAAGSAEGLQAPERARAASAPCGLLGLATSRGMPACGPTCQHGDQPALRADHRQGGPGGHAQLAPHRHGAVIHHRVRDFVPQHCGRRGRGAGHSSHTCARVFLTVALGGMECG